MSNNTINHALDNFLENSKDKQSISSSLTVEINAGLNFLNIRGSIENEDFLSNAEKIFHQPLPTTSNTFTTGSHHIYWLAPNEWLLVTGHDLNSIIKEVNLDFTYTEALAVHNKFSFDVESLSLLLGRNV